MMLNVLDGLERQIEEVAGTACGIEDAEGAQPVTEGAIQDSSLIAEFGRRACLGGAGATSRVLRFLFDLRRLAQLILDLDIRKLPFGEERTHDHRLDNQHDLVAIGIVRAELAALVRVKASLEQRSEDRWINL